MTKKKNFVIFAHARSGSVTLKLILGLHPEINIFGEPFNRTNYESAEKNKFNPDYKRLQPDFEKIKNINTLDNFLAKVNKKYNGFKHLWYSLDEEYNQHLLKNKDYKIIFLTRKNILKSIISLRIALKTDIWSTRNTERHKKIILNNEFDPIPIRVLKEGIKKIKESRKFYRQFLKKNNLPFFEITYEELYGLEVPLDKKVEKIQEIFDFLGYERVTDPKILDEIKNSLNPEKRKINDFETYLKIPNIFEIERELGSKENGYLFDGKGRLIFAQKRLEKIKERIDANEKQ